VVEPLRGSANSSANSERQENHKPDEPEQQERRGYHWKYLAHSLIVAPKDCGIVTSLERAISIIEAVAIATEHAENDFEIVSLHTRHSVSIAQRLTGFYIVLEPTDIRAEWLQTGPMFLWHFLDSVGSVPIALINSNLKQLRQDNATPEQFREEAKRISASYERSEPFVAIARQEADRVEQRINAALQIRRERLAIDKDFDRERLRLNAAIDDALK
jgi:hypothetical protein